MAASVGAAPKPYRLELELIHPLGRRPFLHNFEMDRRERSKFEFDPRRRIEPFLEEAHKALAKKMGYHPKVYGPKFYKNVRITRVVVRILDARSGKVLWERRKL